MNSVWLKGYKDKKAREEQVRSASWAFDLLAEVLDKEYKRKPNVREYNDPQWVHKQIAVNEYNQVIDDILKLIKIDER